MSEKPSISIITVVRNARETVEASVRSVLSQDYPVQYIVIDGNSTDGTKEVLASFAEGIDTYVSEPDSGIYDAMNKGIRLAGGDIIGILNADDLYAGSGVLRKIAGVFADPSVEACYTDLVYVDRERPERVVRYWKSRQYRSGLIEKGWMPAHPTFFARRGVYDRFGLFDLDYKIAADAELLMRLLAKKEIHARYVPGVTVKMRMGGTTNRSIRNMVKQNLEIWGAARKNGLRLSPFFMVHKVWQKFLQYVQRPETVL
ncbi:glycosyltransferase [Geomonas sp. RF6]|uniref:glycosyltransferase family 2 protein n=1 Tax=Geomonas sp. RF6 TaxID=2897342 RepID=UPI001E4E2D4C|nr:glycosyltransferase family 2 protein [Geomonas sp. RF6]UFS71302.1 glycosyltransferase [Geomonas sp. RF6]